MHLLKIMKNTLLISFTISLICFISCSKNDQEIDSHGHHEHSNGHSHHDHSHHNDHSHSHHKDLLHQKIEKGPNGGRLITEITPNFEFFVKQDNTVQLTFIDQNKKPIPPTGAIVQIIGGDRKDPTVLEFNPEGNVLISNLKLPKGNNIPLIVLVNQPNGEKLKTKFNYKIEEFPKVP